MNNPAEISTKTRIEETREREIKRIEVLTSKLKSTYKTRGLTLSNWEWFRLNRSTQEIKDNKEKYPFGSKKQDVYTTMTQRFNDDILGRDVGPDFNLL